MAGPPVERSVKVTVIGTIPDTGFIKVALSGHQAENQ